MKKKRTMKRNTKRNKIRTMRFLALVVSLCLMFTAMPLTAFADTTDEDPYAVKEITLTNAKVSYQDGETPQAGVVIADNDAHYKVVYEEWESLEKVEEDGQTYWQTATQWYSDPDMMLYMDASKKLVTFKKGKYYFYNLELEAIDGRTFPSASEITMTLNGKKIPSGYLIVSEDGTRLSAVSIVTLGQKEPSTDAVIEGITFDYQPGDVPRATASKLDPYGEYDIDYEYWEEMETKADGTVEPVAFWYSDEAKNQVLAADQKIIAFEEGKTYMYSIVLKSDPLCSFSEKCVVMLNGMSIQAENVMNTGTKLFVTAVKTIRPKTSTDEKPVDPCANGHKAQQKITKATVKADGKIVTQCSVCQKTLSTEILPKASGIGLSKTSFVYNGKVQKPSVLVKDRTGRKISTSNYTVSYTKGLKNVGSYDVTIKLKGNYSGTVKKTYVIVPKATTLSGLTAGKKKIIVKWKKQTQQTTGYQIQYGTTSDFKGAKTLAVSKNTTIEKTISGLKAKKKYYVRIRTYKKTGTKTYTSGWSKAKAVTTKK